MGDPEYSLIVEITASSDNCMLGWEIPVQYAMGVQIATQGFFSNCNEETEQVPWHALNWLTQMDRTTQGLDYLKANTVLGFGLGKGGGHHYSLKSPT